MIRSVTFLMLIFLSLSTWNIHAESSNSTNLTQAEVLFEKAEFLYERKEYKGAVPLYIEAYDLLHQIEETPLKAKALSRIIFCYNDLQEFNLIQIYLNKIKKNTSLLLHLSPIEKINFRLIEAQTTLNTKQIYEAQAILIEEISINTQLLKDEGLLARVYYQLAFILYGLKDYTQSVIYFEKAFDATEEDDYYYKVATVDGISCCYAELGQLDLALKKNEESLQLLESFASEFKSKTLLINIENNGADFILQKGDLNSCKDQLSQISNMMDSTVAPLTVAYHYMTYAKYYNRINQFDRSLEYLKTTKEIIDKNNLTSIEDPYFNELVKVYQGKKQVDSVIAIGNQRQQIYEKRFSEQKKLSTDYYLLLDEQKEQERENLILESKSKISKYRSLIAFTGMMFLLFLSGILYNAYRGKKKLTSALNYKLENYTSELQSYKNEFNTKLFHSVEEEKRRISSDLHDSIGQNLLILKNALIKAERSEEADLVQASIEEIRNISRNLYPAVLDKLGITTAIKYLIDKVQQMSEIICVYEIDSIDEYFNDGQSIQLYRIVQELLNNILKHSESRSFKLSIFDLKDHVKLRVKDKGVGFNYEKKLKGRNSFGLNTINERVQILGGKIEVQSSSQDGTKTVIYIPKD